MLTNGVLRSSTSSSSRPLHSALGPRLYFNSLMLIVTGEFLSVCFVFSVTFIDNSFVHYGRWTLLPNIFELRNVNGSWNIERPELVAPISPARPCRLDNHDGRGSSGRTMEIPENKLLQRATADGVSHHTHAWCSRDQRARSTATLRPAGGRPRRGVRRCANEWDLHRWHRYNTLFIAQRQWEIDF